MPIELMELPEGDSALIEGRFCSTSSVRTKPVFSMSSEVTLEIGLMEMSFGACSNRDPVTTTSSTGAGVAGAAACAYTITGAAVVAHAARAKRTAFRTLRLEFDIRFTPLERIWLCSPRWHEPQAPEAAANPPRQLLLKCYTGPAAHAKNPSLVAGLSPAFGARTSFCIIRATCQFQFERWSLITRESTFVTRK